MRWKKTCFRIHLLPKNHKVVVHLSIFSLKKAFYYEKFNMYRSSQKNIISLYVPISFNSWWPVIWSVCLISSHLTLFLYYFDESEKSYFFYKCFSMYF